MIKMLTSKTKRGSEDSPEERRSKRRRAGEENEEEEDREKEGLSKASTSKMKTPLIGGGSSHRPAELFRKDLISAMKLADSEPLASDDYFLIGDQWRQEWERGVQVPVNEEAIPKLDVGEVSNKNKGSGDFKLNPKKQLHAEKDITYRQGNHDLTGMAQLAEQVVRYDLDDLDVCWLGMVNQQREEAGDILIYEWSVERVIEALETQCHENMEIKKKTEEGLGIEYDEDIVCEICQSPDSEDTNEMVFCDGCDICVHQACYGINSVPEGMWLCRICAIGIKPACMLCPKMGGPMKSTRSGTKWAHVSCAIWIPEVTIGCVEKMEPITKISQIPSSRWALICAICKERNGACIQCSVKACKTAFHVTCAMVENLVMRTILIEDEKNEDEAVKLKAYCPKHSKNRERNSSESEPDSPRKSTCGTPRKEMTEEEKETLRADRLKLLDEHFYTVVTLAEIGELLQLDIDVIDVIYTYWKLKRKALFNRPLLTPKTEEADLLEKQQEDSLVARMKMFVHLRQDLERVRNLSYMISRREKMKRQYNRARESVFYAALEVLVDNNTNLSQKDVNDVVTQYKDLSTTSVKGAKYKGKLKAEKSELYTPICKVIDSSMIHKSLKPKLTKTTPKSTESSEALKSSPTTDTQEKVTKSKSKKAERTSILAKKGRRLSETPRSRRLRTVEKAQEGVVIDKELKSEPDSMDTSQSEVDLNNSSQDTNGTLSAIKYTIADDGTQRTPTKATNGGIQAPLNSESLETQMASPPIKKRRGRPPKLKPLVAEITAKDNIASTNVTNTSNSVTKLENSTENEIVDVLSTDSSTPIQPTTETKASSCLSDFIAKVTEKEKDNKPLSRESRSASVLSDSKPAAVKDSKPVSGTATKERRQSVKMTNEEKEKLEKEIPSAKNVSDSVKVELNGYFKNNKLAVSSKLRRKVQNHLLNSKRNKQILNGILVTSQKRIDSYFVKSPPQCETSPDHSSSGKTVSHVLNELSPTRDRFEVNSDIKLRTRSLNSSRTGSPVSEVTNDINRKYDSTLASVKERLFDSEYRRSSRSSRETTPDSCKSSVHSHGSSITDRSENKCDKQTRSDTPLSVSKDLNDEELDHVDVENLYKETKKRWTRSQILEEEMRKEGSLSPKSIIRSHVASVTS